MSAPAVAATGTLTASTTAALSHTPPATVAGDILVVAVMFWGPNSTSLGDIPTPTGGGSNSGWTLIARLNDGASDGQIAWFWTRMTGSSGAIGVARGTGWDTGNDTCYACQSYKITGCRTVGNPWDDVQTAQGTGTTVTYNALTLGGPERTLFAQVTMTDNRANTVTPTNYTLLAADNDGTGTDAGFGAYHYANQTSDGQVTNDLTGALAAGFWGSIHFSFLQPQGIVKTYLGGSWQHKPMKVYKDSAWGVCVLKRWDGTAWMDCDES